jgi:hypothetical protein
MSYEESETCPFCGAVPILTLGPFGRGKSRESQQFLYLGGCYEK